MPFLVPFSTEKVFNFNRKMHMVPRSHTAYKRDYPRGTKKRVYTMLTQCVYILTSNLVLIKWPYCPWRHLTFDPLCSCYVF